MKIGLHNPKEIELKSEVGGAIVPFHEGGDK
jgi:hypothetical protein